MHSRVFQLSTELILEEDFINEYDLEHCFIGKIADYAVTSESRERDIEWLAIGEIIDYHS